MADLTYNSGDLEILGDQLTDLTGKLKDDGRLKELNREEVGHNKVADAIDDFVNDWDDKRKKLTQKVEALAEMASKSHEEFTKADLELAEALKQKAEDD
jgi:predicted  nucleic acid-binding Zn-ribbon protein